MSKIMMITVYIFFLTGCWRTTNYALDVQFRFNLLVFNASKFNIDFEYIFGLPPYKAFFGFDEFSLKPGEGKSTRLDIDGYNELKAGRFKMKGKCGDIDNWKIIGNKDISKAGHFVFKEKFMDQKSFDELVNKYIPKRGVITKYDEGTSGFEVIIKDCVR